MSEEQVKRRLIPVGSSTETINGFPYEFVHVAVVEDSAWLMMNKAERESYCTGVDRDIRNRSEDAAAERAFNAPSSARDRIKDPLDVAVQHKRIT